jgi:hypothetical protein
MSTKKKPANKSVAAKGPTPLLKLKFDKFPDKPVPVFFETTKRCFYAGFGFEQYESPSVPGLEQKIKAAIKAGVTPSPVWVPMIQLGINIAHGRTGYKQALDLDFDVDIERRYFCIGKGGKLRFCDWDVKETGRNNASQEAYGTLANTKPRALNAPIFKRDRNSFDGGCGVEALIPYTDQLWQELGEQIRSLRAQASGLIGHVAAGKLDVFTNFIFDFERSVRPAAAEKPIVTGTLKVTVEKAKPAAKKKQSSRGDNTAREHLVVKYQGKQLTLGHGPLGNYLVEALRKTYPTIDSAFVLKDNRVQLSRYGEDETKVLSAKEFETAINNPPQRGSLEKFVNAGRGAQTAVDQVIATVQRSQGAIAKLHELVDAMQPEDPPLAIPSVILVAAGFPETATAEIYEPQEILIRVPKKAVQFVSLAELEQKILKQIEGKPQEAEKELVGA